MRVWGVTRFGQGDTTYAEKIFGVASSATACGFCGDRSPGNTRNAAFDRCSRTSANETERKGGKRIAGSLLDEMALGHALKEQRLGGAALDVTAIEPLPPESPLWKTPHLMITPHTSAVSDRLWKRQTQILAELLERWFSGRELFNRVDLSRGY